MGKRAVLSMHDHPIPTPALPIANVAVATFPLKGRECAHGRYAHCWKPPKAGETRECHATDQSELANEAIGLYVERETLLLEKIRNGLAQAERGEFVPDGEMDAFFAEHTSIVEP